MYYDDENLDIMKAYYYYKNFPTIKEKIVLPKIILIPYAFFILFLILISFFI